MRRSLLLVTLGAALAGCTSGLGHVPLLPRDGTAPATKLLRPDVEGRSCRRSVFGLAVGPDGEPSISEAIEQILALDAEGDAVANAEVRWERVVTGLHNRRCVVVRGDLVRIISTMTLPVPGGHHHPH